MVYIMDSKLQKPSKNKNSHYLKSQRGRRCQVDGCGELAEPHHVNGLLNENATGSKNDYLSVRLCREHHDEAHDFPKMFWKTHNIDPKNIVIKNLITYIEGMRK